MAREEAKGIYEKFKEGCKEKTVNKQFLWFYPEVALCGSYSKEYKDYGYCKDCQEIKEIHDAILGQGDGGSQ